MVMDAPLQGSLFGAAPIGITPIRAGMERTVLDPCCWVDVNRDWLLGGDDLLADLLDRLPWQGGTRLMYGKLMDEPRLTASSFDPFSPELPAVIGDLARRLQEHYGRPFDAMFCNYYRTGADSVAWHADRVGRRQVDPLVAIISLGGPRRFRIRPMESGPERRRQSTAWDLRSGDLLVMGGAMQHHWEHCVPKVSRAGPRMSVTLRSGPGASREEGEDPPAQRARRSWSTGA
jgi:alkylated DNA repair dioxygenase AlkB